MSSSNGVPGTGWGADILELFVSLTHAVLKLHGTGQKTSSFGGTFAVTILGQP